MLSVSGGESGYTFYWVAVSFFSDMERFFSEVLLLPLILATGLYGYIASSWQMHEPSHLKVGMRCMCTVSEEAHDGPVIQETLRVATVLSFTFREAVEDVDYRGYVIPKGWKVLPLFRNIHHSPEFFPEPLKFDPSRFEVAPKPNTFLPFGNGIHSCPGSDLAKLEMLVFIHHLTTKCRWELDESKTGIQYSPFLVPQEGLPIRVDKR